MQIKYYKILMNFSNRHVFFLFPELWCLVCSNPSAVDPLPKPLANTFTARKKKEYQI